MRCHGGGRGGGKIKAPKPPSPTTAAESLAKNEILERTRRARGYASTMFASLNESAAPATGTMSALKRLLGE